MLEAGVDHLVLGCTHYPFLIPAIKKITHDRITIVDPAPAVALQVQKLVDSAHIAPVPPSPSYRFYATGSADALQAYSRLLCSDAASMAFYAHYEIS